MTAWLEEHGVGKRAVSLQAARLAVQPAALLGRAVPGDPHRRTAQVKLVPESELPVRLPELDDFKPRGGFEPPLARATDWLATTDAETGRPARRDTNTMPQWAGSCWYYLRFTDPHNDAAPFSREAERYWMNVDLYVGGAEHAVLHLLYARFWHKVLFDLGLVHTKEPFQKLLNPGMIQGKSYRLFRDDSARLAEVLLARRRALRGRDAAPRRLGPGARRGVGRAGPGALEGRRGARARGGRRSRGSDREDVQEPRQRGEPRRGDRRVRRRLDAPVRDVHRPAEPRRALVDRRRARRLALPRPRVPAGDGGAGLGRPAAQLRAGPGHGRAAAAAGADDPRSSPTTSRRSTSTPRSRSSWCSCATSRRTRRSRASWPSSSCCCSRRSRRTWPRSSGSSSATPSRWCARRGPWPTRSSSSRDEIELSVQVAGKLRARVRVPADADEAAARAAALGDENVRKHLDGREPRRVIYVPGRLINLVP